MARLGAANFGQGGVYLERFVEHARHIEVQIFGDGAATSSRSASATARRSAAIRRSSRKRPRPVSTPTCAAGCWTPRRRLARAVRYRSAGTVEFLYDADREDFYFLEVNTRLQVEHGVTEEVTGVDIVEWMVRLGAGELPPLETLRPDAARRVDPGARLRRGSGARLPPERGAADRRCACPRARGARPGWTTAPRSRRSTIRCSPRSSCAAPTATRRWRACRTALAATRFDGLETNLDYLRQVVAEPEFRAGGFPTSFLNRVRLSGRARSR